MAIGEKSLKKEMIIRTIGKNHTMIISITQFLFLKLDMI